MTPFFIVEISNTFADADYFMMQDQLNKFIKAKKYPYYLQKRLKKYYNLRYKSCFFNIEVITYIHEHIYFLYCSVDILVKFNWEMLIIDVI